MHSRVSRLARGWIAGSFATGVAAAAHGLADGAPPSALAVVVGLVFAGILGTLVIGRTPSLPRLALIVGGSQVAFHLVFSWLTPGTATAAHHGAATLMTPAVAHHGTDPWMWAAHALALLATIAFLRRAELALWNLLLDALRATRFATIAISARPASAATIAAAGPRHPLAFAVSSVVSRRGPPAPGFAS